MIKKILNKIIPGSEILLTDEEFLKNYNENMPKGFPHVTRELLHKFKSERPSLFKNTKFWSLDQHRKHLINWLPQNI